MISRVKSYWILTQEAASVGIEVAGAVIIQPTLLIQLPAGIAVGLNDCFEDSQPATVAVVEIAIGHRAAAVREMRDRALVIAVVIEKSHASLLQH